MRRRQGVTGENEGRTANTTMEQEAPGRRFLGGCVSIYRVQFGFANWAGPFGSTDTHIWHALGPPVSKSTVYDISWDFLVSLEAERRLDPLRPVLLIAHSLGGIVIKEMLRRSSGCHSGQTHFRSIFESTIGVIF